LLGVGLNSDLDLCHFTLQKPIPSRTDKEIHMHEKEAEYTYTKGITAQGQKREA
jgi:hypothetical protein